jgi:hypothetical protein
MYLKVSKKVHFETRPEWVGIFMISNAKIEGQVLQSNIKRFRGARRSSLNQVNSKVSTVELTIPPIRTALKNLSHGRGRRSRFFEGFDVSFRQFHKQMIRRGLPRVVFQRATHQNGSKFNPVSVR